MPLLTTVGRGSLRSRIIIGSIYTVLIAGSWTMIYPFLLMLAGTTKSWVDTNSAALVPRFLYDDEALYRKHIEGLFNEQLSIARTSYGISVGSFRSIKAPGRPDGELVELWSSFLNTAGLAPQTYSIGYLQARYSAGVLPMALRAFKAEMIERFDGEIGRMNEEMGTDFSSWNAFIRPPSAMLARRHRVVESSFNEAFVRFKERQPVHKRYYYNVEGFFQQQFLRARYAGSIEAYNEARSEEISQWREAPLDRRRPESGSARADWLEFVRTLASLQWIRADSTARPAYLDFLSAKYGSVESLNRQYESSYHSLEEVTFPNSCPEAGLPGSDWESFLQGWQDPADGSMHIMPAESLYIDSVEFMFRDYLDARFGTLDAFNKALGLQHKKWLGVAPPQRDLHFLAFEKSKRDLRWEFATRNFITVFSYLAVHGRGLYNTIIYCGLAVLSALIVNPMAAYALSRYNPPTTPLLLLFLMLTMAFPPMVTQIPVFIMLREMSLLNSFWALILPGLAQGYSIFMLKGFFDSLPRELYESAEIDGAGEIRIFWQITMSLSQPILAVFALGAFGVAYSNFMMAMLVCQDDTMWTLMPWLYQLQQRSGEGVVFASLIVAAVPTFLIFLFCQKVIMRGMVFPVER